MSSIQPTRFNAFTQAHPASATPQARYTAGVTALQAADHVQFGADEPAKPEEPANTAATGEENKKGGSPWMKLGIGAALFGLGFLNLITGIFAPLGIILKVIGGIFGVLGVVDFFKKGDSVATEEKSEEANSATDPAATESSNADETPKPAEGSAEGQPPEGTDPKEEPAKDPKNSGDSGDQGAV